MALLTAASRWASATSCIVALGGCTLLFPSGDFTVGSDGGAVDAPAADATREDAAVDDGSVVDDAGRDAGTGSVAAWDLVLATGGDDSMRAVAIDAAGNVYVTGDLGGGATIGDTEIGTLGGTDVIVASFDPSGDMRWVKTFGDAYEDHGNGIAVDDAGVVYVTGSFVGANATFGDGITLDATGGRDTFVVALDGVSGETRWARSGATMVDEGNAIAALPSGACVAGRFVGDYMLPSGRVLGPSGFDDGYVVCFDSSGMDTRLAWLADAEPAVDRNQQLFGIATFPEGDVLVAGAFQGDVALDGRMLPGESAYQGLYARLDTVSMEARFLTRFGSAATRDSGRCAATGSPPGRGYVGGTVTATNLAGTDVGGAGGDDGLVMAIATSSGGGAIWAHGLGGTLDDLVRSLAVDEGGNVWATGFVDGDAVAIAGRPVETRARDGFLAAFSAEGDVRHHAVFGGAGADEGWAVATRGPRVVVAGQFRASASVEGRTLTGALGDDGFVVALDRSALLSP